VLPSLGLGHPITAIIESGSSLGKGKIFARVSEVTMWSMGGYGRGTVTQRGSDFAGSIISDMRNPSLSLAQPYQPIREFDLEVSVCSSQVGTNCFALGSPWKTQNACF